MYLKLMKFIHTLLGAVLLIGYIVYPNIYASNDSQLAGVIDIYMQPLLLVALTCASSNLLLGCYLAVKQGVKRYFQVLASLLILVSGVISLLLLMQVPLPLSNAVSVLLLVVGLTLHLLLNLYAFHPRSRIVVDVSEREMGTVKWFNNSKGFGFITRDKGSDIFVHYRAIRGEGHRTLVEGQRVEFIIAKKDKGLQAEDVIAASGNH